MFAAVNYIGCMWKNVLFASQYETQIVCKLNNQLNGEIIKVHFKYLIQQLNWFK